MIILDLKINPQLLQPDFNGYKLSLDTPALHKIALTSKIDETFPTEEQYSFLHQKLFALHNHLHSNMFSSDEDGKVYFVDEKWIVYENITNHNSLILEGVKQVWEIPANESRIPGHWNVSLQFSSKDLCTISDGAGTLHVVNTLSTPWTVEYSSEVLGKGVIFSILDCRFIDNVLHICLLSIEEDAPSDEERDCPKQGAKLSNIINWICLHKIQQGEWCLKRQRQIQVPGSIHYLQLNSYGTALYLISDKPYTFTMDSEKQIETNDTLLNTDIKKTPDYFWQQTNEEVTILFPLNTEINKNDINISVTSTEIKIMCTNKILLEGKLNQLIESNLTTWKIENNRLEISLQKTSPSVSWTELVTGDTRGEQILDPAFVQEVHERLAHLCSDSEAKPQDSGTLFNMQQLEECDSISNEDKNFVRIDGETHQTSHQMNLGGHQCLFTCSLVPEECLAICVRSDVDGCILQIKEDETGLLKIDHEGTIQAFGYVQASKSQKKFSTSSSDLSYGVISESSRHVFIYVQSSAVSTELRHRTSGRRVQSISKQYIIALNNEETVMGLQAYAHCLYILTNQNLYMAKINS